MSDAKVTFEGLDYERCAPGQEERFSFACPKQAGVTCAGLRIRKSENQHPSWTWNGNREAPTFAPSINCQGCWHGYITNGRCVDVPGADEPEPTA